jgi:hypothetical protein
MVNKSQGGAYVKTCTQLSQLLCCKERLSVIIYRRGKKPHYFMPIQNLFTILGQASTFYLSLQMRRKQNIFKHFVKS